MFPLLCRSRLDGRIMHSIDGENVARGVLGFFELIFSAVSVLLNAEPSRWSLAILATLRRKELKPLHWDLLLVGVGASTLEQKIVCSRIRGATRVMLQV